MRRRVQIARVRTVQAIVIIDVFRILFLGNMHLFRDNLFEWTSTPLNTTEVSLNSQDVTNITIKY